MIIGYDAKRAFHNTTGLGHYSRTLLRDLNRFFPEHHYLLYHPKPSSLFNLQGLDALQEILPDTAFDRLFSSYWRSSRVVHALKKQSVHLYHGLSHELPNGIEKTGIKTVVTMHDLIHERYPEQYAFIDRKIYTRKFRDACRHADTVIAISKQTQQDLIDFYSVPPEKIRVCYQSCHPAFRERVAASELQRVKALYHLPDRFFLYVGSVIERKNLLAVCKATEMMRDEDSIPLVVIGSGKKYLQTVKSYVEKARLQQRIIFLSEHPAAKQNDFITAADFPAIYQQASAMIYPSYFEGFGIPILEALWSGIPVITAHTSSLTEVGGDAALYVHPDKPEEIAVHMQTLLTAPALVASLIGKGKAQAMLFDNQRTAAEVMACYLELVPA